MVFGVCCVSRYSVLSYFPHSSITNRFHRIDDDWCNCYIVFVDYLLTNVQRRLRFTVSVYSKKVKERDFQFTRQFKINKLGV